MGKYEYDILNQPTADKERDRRAELPLEAFCPLIGGTCIKKCTCYQPPYIQKCDDKYRVTDGYCGNGMFQDRPEL